MLIALTIIVVDMDIEQLVTHFLDSLITVLPNNKLMAIIKKYTQVWTISLVDELECLGTSVKQVGFKMISWFNRDFDFMP